MSKIDPTEGRIVWFRADGAMPWIPHREGKPNAALLVAVNDDGTVNLTVFGSDGSPHPRENVTLVQDGGVEPGQCTWMPFQKGQARKVEDRDAELKAIRERGLVERPDGKGFDVAPANPPGSGASQASDQPNPQPTAEQLQSLGGAGVGTQQEPANQEQAQPQTEPAPPQG